MSYNRTQNLMRIADLDLMDEQDAALAIDRLITAGSNYKAELEREYLTNLDFLEGGVKAWYSWNERHNNRALPEDLAEDELLISFNIILVQVETIVSRMFRPEPVWGALPIPGSEINAMRARMLEQALNYYYETGLNMPMILLRMLTTACASPIVWLTGGWEAGLGNIVRTSFDDFLASAMEDAFPNAEAPVNDIARQEILAETQQRFMTLFSEDALKSGQVVQHAGKLDADSFSVLEGYWYPWRVTDWDKQVELFVRRRPQTVTAMADKYDLDVNDVRSMRNRILTSNSTAPRDFGRPRSRNAPNTEYEEDMIDEKIAWHRPSMKYPDGVQIVYLGHSGTALRTGPLDNKLKIIPCFPLVEHFIPEKLSGTCLISQVRSLAMDTNKAASQDSAYCDQMIWPAVVTSEAGQVDGETQEFSNRPGDHIVVSHMAEKPQTMDRPPLPLDNTNRVTRNIQMMREVSGVSAIQVGKTEGTNVRSGRAINSLDEKLDERLVAWGKRLNKQQEAFATHIATELQTKPVGETVALINGLDNLPEMLRFNKDDLLPEVDSDQHTALIRVTAFSELRMSRSMNSQFVLSLVKATILQPGRDDAKIWRMLGSSDAYAFEDEDRTDRARQTREIDLWRQGMLTPKPLLYEGHDSQIDVIIKWIRGGEALTVIRRFPYMMAHIYSHLRYHQTMKMIEQHKMVLLDTRARFEAWTQTIEDVAYDANQGDATAAKLFDAQDILLPFEAVMMNPAMEGMGLGAQEAAMLRAKSGVQQPDPANQGGGTNNQGTPPKQAEAPMNYEERDSRKDRADKGVPREQLTG